MAVPQGILVCKRDWVTLISSTILKHASLLRILLIFPLSMYSFPSTEMSLLSTSFFFKFPYGVRGLIYIIETNKGLFGAI